MKFEIDFNYGTDDATLEALGAKEEHFEHSSAYYIEIDQFEELELILNVLDDLTEDIYSAVISFSPPTIYLDSKV